MEYSFCNDEDADDKAAMHCRMSSRVDGCCCCCCQENDEYEDVSSEDVLWRWLDTVLVEGGTSFVTVVVVITKGRFHEEDKEEELWREDVEAW